MWRSGIRAAFSTSPCPFWICQPRLRSWSSITQRGVRPKRVEVHAPLFYQDAQLFDRIKDLAIEELISEFRVERFAVAVLPWGAGFDVQRSGASCGEPLALIHGHELRPIVRS